MRSLFNQAEYLQIRSRIGKLQPAAVRRWGQMDAAQMLAHCNDSLKHLPGKVPIAGKSNFLTRTMVKSLVMGAVRKGELAKAGTQFRNLW